MHRLPKPAEVGFKLEHFAAIREDGSTAGFLDVHSENYMGAGGLFAIKCATRCRFKHEYALPLIRSNIAAVMETTAKHVLPVSMILGLGIWLSTPGPLGMTAKIQALVNPDAWVTHVLWALALLAIVARGSGALSLDRLFGLDGQALRGATTVVRAV